MGLLEIIALLELYHYGAPSIETAIQELAVQSLEFQLLIQDGVVDWELTDKGLKYVDKLLATPKE